MNNVEFIQSHMGGDEYDILIFSYKSIFRKCVEE